MRQFAVSGTFNTAAYLAECCKLLGVLYGVGLVLWIVGDTLAASARVSVPADNLLNSIPLLGKVRRNLALARFCAVYEMQLQAGINLIDGLKAAADASNSARLKAPIERALPGVLEGKSLSVALGDANAFPAALRRSFRVGENTGSLDEDLRRWAGYHQQAAIDALKSLGNWLGRVISLLVLVYIGYLIVETYSSILNGTYSKALDESF